ncbi:predicted GPI-anchored protein 58 [Balaenoptera musculus]|uniref:Predicted GPI-anchored protein 58 n=1 Tax=Balaenoptera musculus TaxID=9771 RepID=A0A8B8X145_BALMU|nr:predicted GPI-anchored protein 58 [Balaenoptera musculus]
MLPPAVGPPARTQRTGGTAQATGFRAPPTPRAPQRAPTAPPPPPSSQLRARPGTASTPRAPARPGYYMATTHFRCRPPRAHARPRPRLRTRAPCRPGSARALRLRMERPPSPGACSLPTTGGREEAPPTAGISIGEPWEQWKPRLSRGCSLSSPLPEEDRHVTRHHPIRAWAAGVAAVPAKYERGGRGSSGAGGRASSSGRLSGARASAA